MSGLTNEQQADVEERKQAFMERYIKLSEELQIDFKQYPVWVPTGPGLWGLVLNADVEDRKYAALLSPIQPR